MYEGPVDESRKKIHFERTILNLDFLAYFPNLRELSCYDCEGGISLLPLRHVPILVTLYLERHPALNHPP